MRDRLIYILKHSKRIQFLYRKIMSAVFQCLGVFVKQDEKLILFSSFAGKKFNDSPKVLYDAICEDPRYADYRLVWAFEHPDKFDLPRGEKIKMDGLTYFLTALKAKIWICSVNIERGLSFKKKNTIYINTWHGAGTKKIGNACAGRNDYDFSGVDMMLVQSRFEREIFERDFRCRPEAIRVVGFPRNDELFTIASDSKKVEELRKQFDIPEGKKVILYAPTWRDSKDGGLSYKFEAPMNVAKWKEMLSGEYVMLFRMHTFTTIFDMKYDEFARNVSSYDNLNHILAICDVVITDYSTIVYDSAVARKPFICWGFDYDRYYEERGFYFDLNDEYPGGVFKTEDEVIARLKLVVDGADADKYEAFRAKYIEAGGDSVNQIVKELSDKLGLN